MSQWQEAVSVLHNQIGKPGRRCSPRMREEKIHMVEAYGTPSRVSSACPTGIYELVVACGREI